MKSKRICYWSIGWGDYSYMIQSLINSKLKFQIDGDFIAFSDKSIKNCVNEKLDNNISLDLSSYMFKFDYLLKLLEYDYDYFIFVDADSLFVNKPNMCPTILVDKTPWHSFLESPINLITTKRKDWWGVPVNTLTRMYRELGIASSEIRNMNAGFWICKKQFIEQAVKLGRECYQFFASRGFKITEEIPMAYISNYISADNSIHFHEKYSNYWASDWTGVFKDSIPQYKEWEYESYMTGEKFTVLPCLIHAIRSKKVLVEIGKNYLSTSP